MIEKFDCKKDERLEVFFAKDQDMNVLLKKGVYISLARYSGRQLLLYVHYGRTLNALRDAVV